MKSFLCSIIMMFIVCDVGITYAVTHSTQENFNYIFKICLSAIYETEDFTEVMRKGNDDVIDIRRQDCWRLAESIKLLSQYSAEGLESKSCILETSVILVSRGTALGYYLDAINSYRAGNIGLYEEYVRRMTKAWKEAEQFRQEFRAKYGY